VQTSAVFKESFGKDFKEELSLYSKWLLDTYGNFKASEGEIVATSKSHKKLNSNKEDIFFLTSDAVSKPKLHVLSKVDGKSHRQMRSPKHVDKADAKNIKEMIN
jgi:enterochelin esterase-like enzyme